MLESQIELRDNIKNMFDRFSKYMPDIARAYEELPNLHEKGLVNE